MHGAAVRGLRVTQPHANIMAFLRRASNATTGGKGITNDEPKHTNQCQGLDQIITIYDCSNKVTSTQVALYFPHTVLNVSVHL